MKRRGFLILTSAVAAGLSSTFVGREVDARRVADVDRAEALLDVELSHVRSVGGRVLGVRRADGRVLECTNNGWAVATIATDARVLALSPAGLGAVLATRDGNLVWLDPSLAAVVRQMAVRDATITSVAALGSTVFGWDAASRSLLVFDGDDVQRRSVDGLRSVRELVAFGDRVLAVDPVTSAVVDVTGERSQTVWQSDPRSERAPLATLVASDTLWVRTLSERIEVAGGGVA